MKTTEERYAAFVLDGTAGNVRLIDLGEAASIVAAVDAFRKCEKSPAADQVNFSLDENQLATFGENLRRMVLDPALPSQFHLQRLYLAPDSVLAQIPLTPCPRQKQQMVGATWPRIRR